MVKVVRIVKKIYSRDFLHFAGINFREFAFLKNFAGI